MTTEDYVDKYLLSLKRKGYSILTIESYRREIRQFVRFLDEFYPRVTSPAEVKREIVTDYQDYLGERRTRADRPLSNRTISVKLSALKTFFRFLSDEDYILSDPTRNIAMPKEELRLPKAVLTEKEVMMILESSDTRTPLGLRNRAVLELLYACGMRTSELCNLKTLDLSLKDQTVLIEKGKGNVSRLVPIGQYATLYIQEYLKKGRKFLLRGKRSDPGNLFLTQFGNPFDRKSINKSIMKPIQQRLKLKKNLTAYSWRHACATHLLHRNVDVTYIAQLLGHRSLNTTQQYLKIEIGDLKRMHSLYHPRER
jgi:integrase/recombinase XerD